jgi:predicted Zn-dependent peptidase
MNNYAIKQLPNGLEYIYIDNPTVDTISLCVSIRVGSNQEDENVNGISHLLEHMIYKSNHLFKTKYDLYRALDSIGAIYNAYTDKNITTFFVKSDAIHQERLIQIFSSLICEPIINPIDLENEKKIVIEEIRNTEDDPFDIIYNKFFKLMYIDHPIAQKISGNPQNITNITFDDVKKHINQFYTANNMVVSLTGKLQPNIHKLMEQSSFVRAKQSISSFLKNSSLTHSKTTSIDFIDKPIKQIYLGISFPTKGLYDNDKYTVKLLELILNGSMSSRLFVELREKKGLVYSISTSNINYQEGGMFYTITSFDKDKYIDVIRSLLTEFHLLQKELISENELNRWKNFIKSSMKMETENTMDVADYYARELLFHRDNITSFSDLLIKHVEPTREDILRVSKQLFDWKHLKLIIMGDLSTNRNNIVKNIMSIIKETYDK